MAKKAILWSVYKTICMTRSICIHGHFYQPPRENPWLEQIEQQDSAHPYHNWNERINAECYAPNALARIHNDRGRTTSIVNNYARISYNFGPTLLDWMEKADPDTYKAILQADKESRIRFSGCGSAMAQVYNHIILPLACRRDKISEIRWGIRDFEKRFARKPEGMWLAETAADTESLELMAKEGIAFTILAPHQAEAWRNEGENWQEIESSIDPSRPYRIALPNNRSIVAFFYDGPISHKLAFGDLLENGENFVRSLMGGFHEDRDWDQLVHIATDGETYGHHHRNGEMALAYALNVIDSRKDVKLTNYAEYLLRHPPRWQARLRENTSWSCAHGVERWRSNCGCRINQDPVDSPDILDSQDAGQESSQQARQEANQHQNQHIGQQPSQQAWRKPLRESMDTLRNALSRLYESCGKEYFHDPWQARDAYIDLILDRSTRATDAFFDAYCRRKMTPEDRSATLKLLEMQRHALLMYTSCAWFFDDISGIESVQCMEYAARAIQLGKEFNGQDLEKNFLDTLQEAIGNSPQSTNGREIYESEVRPSEVNLASVCAHFAMSTLLEKSDETNATGSTSVYCFDAELEEYHVIKQGRSSLAAGRARIASRITEESEVFIFAVLHRGDHNLHAGIKIYHDEENAMAVLENSHESFTAEDFDTVIRNIDSIFTANPYTLNSLFRDQRASVINSILNTALQDVKTLMMQVQDRHRPLISYLSKLKQPLPPLLKSLNQTFNNVELGNLLNAKDNLNFKRIAQLIDESRALHLHLDVPGLAMQLEQILEYMISIFTNNSENTGSLIEMNQILELARDAEIPLNLWKTQNAFYKIMKDIYGSYRFRANAGETDATRWCHLLETLGDNLSIEVDENPP